MKRIVSNSVTEALMSVMEDAENLDQVVILYRYKPTEPDPNKDPHCHYGIQHNKEVTLETANWLVSMFQGWLLSRFYSRDD